MVKEGGSSSDIYATIMSLRIIKTDQWLTLTTAVVELPMELYAQFRYLP